MHCRTGVRIGDINQYIPVELTSEEPDSIINQFSREAAD